MVLVGRIGIWDYCLKFVFLLILCCNGVNEFGDFVRNYNVVIVFGGWEWLCIVILFWFYVNLGVYVFFCEIGWLGLWMYDKLVLLEIWILNFIFVCYGGWLSYLE